MSMARTSSSSMVWGRDDPMFPATRIEQGPDRQFRVGGLARAPWSNAGPVRVIFKQAFAASGLPSFNPHSFRHALAIFGERICKTPEAFKAWSQNLGHERVMTTFASYGEVSAHRQSEIIKGLGKKGEAVPDWQDMADQLTQLARGRSSAAGKLAARAPTWAKTWVSPATNQKSKKYQQP
jgi:hypothetical protein